MASLSSGRSLGAIGEWRASARHALPSLRPSSPNTLDPTALVSPLCFSKDVWARVVLALKRS